VPHNIKRIVSTNFTAERNPLKSAIFNGNPVIPPFLVKNGGILQPVTIDNWSGDWDVMVLNDGENLGLSNVGQLSEVTEVLWLYHRVVAKGQLNKLNHLFNKCHVQQISFQHTSEYYDLYLNKVEALWKPGGGEYGAKLAELDCALRAEQAESDIVDFLWLLAVQLHSPIDTNLDDLDDIVEKKLAVVEQWALTDDHCSSFTTLVRAVSSADNDDDNKRAAYSKLKNALGNSLAGRDPVRDAMSPA
jgi:hypothetical protein